MKNRKSPLFEQVRIKKPRYNAFDLGHEKKLSMNMGDLVPVLVQEVIPGDRFRVNTEMMMRLAPMVAPIMHRVNVFTHFFFVPNRLLWSEWETFITGGEDGLQAPAFPVSTIDNLRAHAYFEKGSLADYLGYPVIDNIQVQNHNFNVSMLPFRAYQTVYNEYYRDQNLTAKVGVTKNSVVDGSEFDQIVRLRKRAWEKDYFTSASPWAQRGGEVTMPLGEPNYSAVSKVTDNLGNPVDSGALESDAEGNLKISGVALGRIENLDSVGTTTINELRRAYRLQEWLEKNARAGSRYIEQILSHFGVMSSDARLQRPQYLGGGKSPVVISEVLSTVEGENSTGQTIPQGNMSGHGIAVGNTHQFNERFEEHGFIIGICSVLPRTAYAQGIDRICYKTDKFDYYWPEFAHLGEQEVLNQELYFDWADAGYNNEVFGYQSRYAEYKFKNSSVHGDFREDLEHFHMARKFGNQPSLNTTFVEANPTHRIFAVSDENFHKLYVQIYNDVKAVRPMPIFGTPSI